MPQYVPASAGSQGDRCSIDTLLATPVGQLLFLCMHGHDEIDRSCVGEATFGKHSAEPEHPAS